MAGDTNTTTGPVSDDAAALDFIRAIVAEDVRAGKHGGRVATRFPPEPNGYLHIGHAKSICLNFGVAAEFGGTCNLRFDDTNPTKEDVEYVDSIMEDVRWLGFQWNGEPRYASDYFGTLYEYAEHLIQNGKAYVDSLTAEEIRAYRGTLTATGRSRRTSTCSAGCAPGSSRTAPTCSARRSTWRRRTSTCGTPCSTASAGRTITGPATRGASTRCTTSRTLPPTRSS
jgi:glutamyl/glutaminyl-tRNA synthetase